MKYKLVSFEYEAECLIGVLIEDRDTVYAVRDLKGLHNIRTMYDAVDCGSDAVRRAIADADTAKLIGVPLDSVRICSPFPLLRRNIICLGFNYLDHIGETKSALGREIKIPEHPIYFSKMAAETIGHGDAVDSRYAEELDYEVELAVIIGRRGSNIAAEDAQDYIFGYTVMNDLSDRYLQRIHKQYLKGKSQDTFTSLGPFVVPADQIDWPVRLALRSSVNGQPRQDSSTDHLLFDIPTIISDLSRGLTLQPGDIIATGTPSGVGMGFSPQRFLRPGDTVSCQIEGIGILTNKVK